MNELIKINYESDHPTVSGRDLHAALQIKTDYPHWFDRVKEYGFTDGEDFNSVKFVRIQTEGTRDVSREMIMKRALEIANANVKKATDRSFRFDRGQTDHAAQSRLF